TEIGQAITVADLKFDKAKVEIKADPEEVVAKIDALAEEVELPPVPAEGGEAVEGGEAPVEGEEGVAEAPSEEGGEAKEEKTSDEE
ncbi:MAG: hypothetical protein Q8Q24_02075, partial [bacterium]|nr:hypothetical protein [bacterium]